MGESVVICFVVLAMLGGALPGGAIAIWRGYWRLGIAGWLLALLPLPLFLILLDIICDLRNLTMHG